MKPDTADRGKREGARRRRFPEAFKRQVVEETLAGDASVAAVALRHRLNANLVFTWRRKLLPRLAPAVAPEPIAASKLARRARARGAIEIEFNGARIVLRGAVNAQALRAVLEALVSR